MLRVQTIAVVVLAAACSPPPPAVVPTAEGIFLVDLDGSNLTRLAWVPYAENRFSQIKFGVLPLGDGRFDIAYVSDEIGDLHSFTADLRSPPATATEPILRLKRTAANFANGPSYCSARRELVVGSVEPSSVGAYLATLDTLQAVEASPIDAAIGGGTLRAVSAEDRRVATDLTCGNLAEGIVYNGVDCSAFSSSSDCLSQGQMLSSIHYRRSQAEAPERLTFPENDPVILQSPKRPVNTVLGDNGPSVIVADDGSRHLMFERSYTTEASLTDPKISDEFRDWGFSRLMYKHLTANAADAQEYVLDFTPGLARPAPHASVSAVNILLGGAEAERVEFVATGVLKAPNATTGIDEDVYVGIFRGGFDTRSLPTAGNVIDIHPDALGMGVVTFAEFTCWAWDTYGFAPGGDVYLYGTMQPQFVIASDAVRVLFSTAKGRIGEAREEEIIFDDGSRQPIADFRTSICGSTP